MRKTNLNDESLSGMGLLLLSESETTEIVGGGWLDSLIGAAFSALGNWVVSLFNEGIEIN
jgi:hypothetical protein